VRWRGWQKELDGGKKGPGRVGQRLEMGTGWKLNTKKKNSKTDGEDLGHKDSGKIIRDHRRRQNAVLSGRGRRLERRTYRRASRTHNGVLENHSQ